MEIFTIKRYIIKNKLHFSKISSRILMKMCGNLRKDLLPEYGHPLPTKPKGVYPLQFTNCRSICSQALPKNFGSSRRISQVIKHIVPQKQFQLLVVFDLSIPSICIRTFLCQILTAWLCRPILNTRFFIRTIL